MEKANRKYGFLMFKRNENLNNFEEKKRELIICLKDYESKSEEELSFQMGDLFQVLGESDNKDYLVVKEYCGSKRGIVPFSHIMLCDRNLVEKIGQKDQNNNQDKEILRLKNELHEKNHELEEYKKKVRELNTMLNIENTTMMKITDPNIEKLVSEGYPRVFLNIVKKNIRSSVILKKLKSVIMEYSVHVSAKPQRLRMNIIKEIISSEKTYVDGLLISLKEFMYPMIDESENHKSNFISIHKIREIFSTMGIIYEMNNNFLNDLKDRLGEISSRRFSTFGDIFLKFIPVLKVYSFYLRNYENAQNVLNDTLSKNPNFSLFLKKIEEVFKNINNYLILPVQRLPRYEMLLKTLLQYTPQTHVDFENLKLALEKLTLVTKEINEIKKEDQNNKVIKQLNKDFINLTFPLSTTETPREFIQQGKLYLGFKRSDTLLDTNSFHFVLFNNLLIQSSKKMGGKLNIVETWSFENGFMLKNMEETEDIKNAFELVWEDSKTKKVTNKTFCCSLPKEKEEWITLINIFFQSNPSMVYETNTINKLPGIQKTLSFSSPQVGQNNVPVLPKSLSMEIIPLVLHQPHNSYIRIGDIIVLKHYTTHSYLSSDAISYFHKEGSSTQQVFCVKGIASDKEKFIVEPPFNSAKSLGNSVLKNDVSFSLRHYTTRKYLTALGSFTSPTTKQKEVSCCNSATKEPKANTYLNWTMSDLKESQLKKGIKFRLKHNYLGQHLHSHKDTYPYHPDDPKKEHQEVTLFGKKDKNDYWIVDQVFC